MNCRSAPRAATWLLERLGSGSRFEPLVGDLIEQFEEGRSRVWYWRQATGALAGHFLGALRTHAPSFIAAILGGCVLSFVWQLGCSFAFQSVFANLAEVKRHPWSLEAFLRLAGMQAQMGSEFALYFTSAWLVTRVHRAHQRAVLVVFVAALMARHLPSIAGLISDRTASSDLLVSLATPIILAALQGACTLVAGLWVIRTKPLAEVDRRTRVVAMFWIAQTFVTGLLFAACRVGEITYRRSEFYPSMYAIGAAGGLYLAVLLWRQNSMTSEVDSIASTGTTRGPT